MLPMEKKCWKIFFRFFNLKRPPGTPECPQKMSAHLVQPFDRILVTYIYTNVLFYYIDIHVKATRAGQTKLAHFF